MAEAQERSLPKARAGRADGQAWDEAAHSAREWHQNSCYCPKTDACGGSNPACGVRARAHRERSGTWLAADGRFIFRLLMKRRRRREQRKPLHRSHMHMQKEPNCPSLETNHSGFYKPHYRTWHAYFSFYYVCKQWSYWKENQTLFLPVTTISLFLSACFILFYFPFFPSAE